MVGQEAMGMSCNTVRYKEIDFIFHHKNDHRLEQVPRVFWIFVHSDAQNLTVCIPGPAHLENPA